MFTSRKTHIENIYRKVLGREVDSEGLNHYLNSKHSIDDIENIIYDSLEYYQRIFELADINHPLIDMPRNLPKDTTVKFYDIDTEVIVDEAKKKFGSSWRWTDVDITYSLNSLGYRMKEFDKVDWSNYMAVFGCSFTAGVGLPLEETFSYKISNTLKLDLVNAGIPGGSNDLILANIVRLLNSNKLPKLIIVNWTSLSRKSYLYDGKRQLYGAVNNHSDWKKSYDNYIENNRQWVFEFIEIKNHVDALCKLLNIPIWHITSFKGYDFYPCIDKFIHDEPSIVSNSNNIEYLNKYVARDFCVNTCHCHPGIQLQNEIYNGWMTIKNNFGFN
jgi:hypothetical protein